MQSSVVILSYRVTEEMQNIGLPSLGSTGFLNVVVGFLGEVLEFLADKQNRGLISLSHFKGHHHYKNGFKITFQ